MHAIHVVYTCTSVNHIKWYIYNMFLLHILVAQLLRALPRMQKVVGSNPTQGSSFFFKDNCLGICIVLFHCVSGVSWSFIMHATVLIYH